MDFCRIPTRLGASPIHYIWSTAMTATALKQNEFYNPIDIVETVVMDRDWVFDRPEDGELVAEANGQWCKYLVGFAWQEDAGGLGLTCAIDSKLPKAALPKVHTLLALVNEKLWLGHFTLLSEDMTVAFSHSLLVRDNNVSGELLGELLDIAVEECERFYPALQSVIWGGADPERALAMAIFDTVAEA